MNKKSAWISIVIILALGGAWLFAYLRGYTASPDAWGNKNANKKAENQPTSASSLSYTLEEVARGLYIPWSIVFSSETRLLVSERNGHIRIIENGQLLKNSLAEFKVSSSGEEGLMGLALDPDYADTKIIFACFASGEKGRLYDQVVSFRDEGDKISNQKTLINNIPAATNHAGCRLLFLPDKTLLVTTGDATDRRIAQDKSSLGGKILRLNRDGSIPTDNPFPNSPVWSYGHRNSQGLAYDASHNILWETEHGPSGFDGPGGGDEINIITKGLNYGWPLIHHKQKKSGLVSPLLEFTPAVAPSALLFYTGEALPQFKDHLLFAALKGEGIFHLTIDEKNPERISAFEKLKDINVGRVREITQAPDGSIYFATSNRDGRGKLRDGDDKIYRIVPK